MQSLEKFEWFISLLNRLSLEKLQSTVLHYLIWSPAQISESVIIFQRLIQESHITYVGESHSTYFPMQRIS